MSAILAVRAGRCSRRGNTKWVDPEPQRGVLWCTIEDQLLHFRWKQIGEGAISNPDIDLDLIVFPDDASFEKVSQRDRVYVLKFASSGDKTFFWMQDPATTLDDWAATSINALIADPSARPGPQPTASSSSAPAARATATTNGDVDMADSAPSSNQADFSNIIANLSRQLGQQQQPSQPHQSQSQQEAPLTIPDVIPHTALNSFLSTLPPERVRELAEQYLPATVPHDAQHLRKTIESPEFRRGAIGLDTALRTGALGPVVRSLGLPDNAALGVEAFLEAIQKQADGAKSASMQTD